MEPRARSLCFHVRQREGRRATPGPGLVQTPHGTWPHGLLSLEGLSGDFPRTAVSSSLFILLGLGGE